MGGGGGGGVGGGTIGHPTAKLKPGQIKVADYQAPKPPQLASYQGGDPDPQCEPQFNNLRQSRHARGPPCLKWPITLDAVALALEVNSFPPHHLADPYSPWLPRPPCPGRDLEGRVVTRGQSSSLPPPPPPAPLFKLRSSDTDQRCRGSDTDAFYWVTDKRLEGLGRWNRVPINPYTCSSLVLDPCSIAWHFLLQGTAKRGRRRWAGSGLHHTPSERAGLDEV